MLHCVARAGGAAKRRRTDGAADDSTSTSDGAYLLYRELASLANSISQPSLVFWMLELCSEQTPWVAGSRAGAFRYGAWVALLGMCWVALLGM